MFSAGFFGGDRMKVIILTFLCLILFFGTADAQSKIVPIIEINSRALLGGVENGKWIDAKSALAKLSNENRYKTYDLNPGSNGGGAVEYPKPEDEGVPCEGFYSVKVETGDKSGVAIGETAAWKAVPRNFKTIDLGDATYKKAVADVLRSKGITNPKIKLTQAFRVDLEGDGQEEVLIEATSYSGIMQPSAKKGDYSLVLLRKIVGGKVQNTVVSGDFVTKNIKFGAPSKFQLSALADLNGDGKIEIVIYGSYYEGLWVETYEMKGNKPTRVKAFDVGCGV